MKRCYVVKTFYKLKKYSKFSELYDRLSIEMRATIWFVLCNCIQKGMAIITIPIFTHIMSVEQYGLYSVYHTWSSLLSVIVTLNLSSGAFNNGMLRFTKTKNSYTSAMQSLTTAMAFGWFIIYFVLRKFFNAFFDLTTPMVICMFIEIVLNASFSFWAAKERYEFKYVLLVLTSIGYAVLMIAIPAATVFFLADIDNSALYRIIAGLFALILSYGWIYIWILYRGKKFFSKEFWLFGLKFNLPLLPHYLAMTVLGQIDRIMIKQMVGAREAAIYTVAYSIAICLQIFTTALNQGFAPWLYRKMHEKDHINIPEIINSQLLLMNVMTLLLSLMSPEIIKLLSTKDYFEASYIIAPIAGSTFFIFIFQLLANFEFYFYKNVFIAIGSAIAALSNLLLNRIFIARFGYYAAGYTTLISYAILAVMHCIFVFFILKKNYGFVGEFVDVRSLAILSVLVVVTSIIVIFIYQYTCLRMCIVLTIFILLYVKRKAIIKLFLKRNGGELK